DGGNVCRLASGDRLYARSGIVVGRQKEIRMSRFFFLRIMILAFVLSFVKSGFSQDYQEGISETGQLESLAERRDADPEDDSYEMDLEYRKHHPLDLNHASADELAALHFRPPCRLTISCCI